MHKSLRCTPSLVAAPMEALNQLTLLKNISPFPIKTMARQMLANGIFI